MAIKLQIRRGTAADWAAGTANPTLLAGEIGYETDTGNFKVGDGTRDWNNLPYQMPYFTGSKPITNTSTTQSRIVVDQTNDRVGIGTSTPLDKLHIEGSSPIIRLRDTDSGAGIYSQINANAMDGTLVISADANNASGTTGASKIQFAVDNTTQVTVTKDTQVGIGTTSPASSLHIVSPTTTADINLVNSGTTGGSGGLVVKSTNNDAFITNVENADLRFGTNNTDRVTIDSTGEVGIGTTTPLSLLHLEGTAPVIRFRDTAAAASTHSTISADNADGTITINADAGNNTTTSNVSKIQFAVDASTHVTIKNDGNVGIGETDPAAPLTIKRTGVVEILLDPNQGSGAYSTITGTTTGGIALQADPGNTGSNTQISAQVDGTERLRVQNVADSNVLIPSGQTLRVDGILRPTLGNITPNTIAYDALEYSNVAGGMILGRIVAGNGPIQSLGQAAIKSWLAYGSMADETKTDYVSTLSQVRSITFGVAVGTGGSVSDLTSSFDMVAGTGLYYLRPKTSVGGTWSVLKLEAGTSVFVTGVTSSSTSVPIQSSTASSLFVALRTA